MTAVPRTLTALAETRGTAARPRAGLRWLVVPPLVLVVTVLVFFPLHTKLGWDESVYVSQVDPRTVTEYFSAPRAVGVPWLVAPLVALTGSMPALRIYLMLVSAVGLFLALACWRRLRGGPTLALAGSLFATLWMVGYYAAQAMPNMWVALCGLAAVGSFLTATRDHAARWPLPALVVSLAIAALMRPSDAAWLALPMFLASLVVRRWRRPLLTVAVVAGIALGGLEWIVEAYLRYGGLLHRIHESSVIEGGFGLHAAYWDALRSVNGPVLCRPCTTHWHDKAQTLWWLVLPFAVIAGVWVRRRRIEPGDGTGLLAALCALAASVTYLVTIPYSAPRFFLPAYALLAIPVADLLCWLLAGARPSWRRWTVPAVVVLLLAQLMTQNAALAREAGAAPHNHDLYPRAASALRGLGIRPPCMLTGSISQPVDFYLGCDAAQALGSHDGRLTPAVIRQIATTRQTAVLVYPGHRRPRYAAGWTEHRLPGVGDGGYRVYVAPAPPGGSR